MEQVPAKNLDDTSVPVTGATRPEAPEVTLTDRERVWCDGASEIRGGPGYRPSALGHPRVWLQVDPDTGMVECGYCDRRFVLRGGPADTPGEGGTMR